jgi:hypothetical protein
MSKWLITASEIKNYTMLVEAEDRDDALDIARNCEMSEFSHDGGEFTVDYADPYED